MTFETSSGSPDLVEVPGWAEFSWLKAGFSIRTGGLTSVYGEPGEQNLGFTKEDAPEVVAENRSRFLAAVRGNNILPLLTVGQIHSAVIHTVAGANDPRTQGLMTSEGKPCLRGDGLITETPGLMLGIITADCVPVLLADTRTHAVAALHAGWRGTLACIVEHGIQSMREQFAIKPEDLVAAIGPGISSCCFEIGEEVKSAFLSHFDYAPALLTETGPQIHLDLMEANRRQLVEAGVPADRISMVGECTACTRLNDGRRKYFSHRAEKGITGRMLNVIGAVA